MLMVDEYFHSISYTVLYGDALLWFLTTTQFNVHKNISQKIK